MGQPDKEIIDFARKSKVPVVETEGVKLVPNAGCVMVSNEQIGRAAAEHVLSLNFKHLGFVTFDENAAICAIIITTGSPSGVVAEDLGVSLRKVQTTFQQYLGHSMLDELTRLRVEHSKRLLLNPKLKIETVGVESGFSKRFHFIRALAPGYTYDSSPSQSDALPVSQNQLPPMIYVMMIAVDEKSFGRFLTNSAYQYRMGTLGAPNSGDIYQVTNALANLHISYRIFTAAVSLTPN
jgi:AraC-like DNA-binding protein